MIPIFKAGGRIVTGTSRAQAVESSESCPTCVDVVVIGGGYVGCCTALELAERGLSVALCEKGVIAGEASGRSFGWIDSQWLDPVKMELIGRSKALWDTMNERVGADTGYRRNGLVSLLEDDDGIAMATDWLDSVRGLAGVDAELIAGSELQSLIPSSTRDWKAALYQPSDASVEPRMAAPAIATGALNKGVHVLQQCAVRGVETSGGRVSAAVTERGTIRCESIVLAAGAWSPLFAGSLGLRLPQFQAHASMVRTEPLDGPTTSAWGNGYTWKQNIDGGYTLGAVNGAAPITPSLLKNSFKLLPAIRAMWDQVDPVFSASTFLTQLMTPSTWPMDRPSPFEENRILEPEIRHKVLDEVCRGLCEDFPAFAGLLEAERWAGVLVTTLDNMPVISAQDELPGLYLGTGFYYGLTMGPAAGEALADLVTGQTPKIDLAPYRYQRFVDGSTLIFRA